MLSYSTELLIYFRETVVIAIGYKDVDRPGALDKVRAELLIAKGATLTIERNVPNITNLIIDMG